MIIMIAFACDVNRRRLLTTIPEVAEVFFALWKRGGPAVMLAVEGKTEGG